MDNTNKYLLNYKGYNFLSAIFNDVEFLENIEDFEIRDDNVFIINMPNLVPSGLSRY